MDSLTLGVVISLVTYAFVSSVTPGPNNLMLLASGAKFGFRRTIPHLLGICFGFSLVLLAAGLGLAQLFGQYPITYEILKYSGAAYLIYLSYRIATAGPIKREDLESADAVAASNAKFDKSKKLESKKPELKNRALKPMSFFGATLFQWVNPKAVFMAISYFSAYVPLDSEHKTEDWQLLAIVIGLYAPINLFSVSLWAWMGVKLADYLGDSRKSHIFNWTMAIL